MPLGLTTLRRAVPLSRTAHRDVLRAFARLPLASDPEAQRALRPAVEELAFATALDAADSDSNRPKVIWAFTAPRTWLGHTVPGSRWGIDNPVGMMSIGP